MTIGVNPFLYQITRAEVRVFLSHFQDQWNGGRTRLTVADIQTPSTAFSTQPDRFQYSEVVPQIDPISDFSRFRLHLLNNEIRVVFHR